ncbi:unnamed protein product, partial [Scytosiphon promiscuus]
VNRHSPQACTDNISTKSSRFKQQENQATQFLAADTALQTVPIGKVGNKQRVLERRRLKVGTIAQGLQWLSNRGYESYFSFCIRSTENCWRKWQGSTLFGRRFTSTADVLRDPLAHPSTQFFYRSVCECITLPSFSIISNGLRGDWLRFACVSQVPVLILGGFSDASREEQLSMRGVEW